MKCFCHDLFSLRTQVMKLTMNGHKAYLMLYTGRSFFLAMKCVCCKDSRNECRKCGGRKFCFLGRLSFFFFGREGQAFLKTLDVCLLVRFLNVLALWGESQFFIISKFKDPKVYTQRSVTQRSIPCGL